MKKIHKQIIHAQAKSIRKATAQISNPKKKVRFFNGDPDQHYRKQVALCNIRFMSIHSKFKAMPDSKLAKFYRHRFTKHDGVELNRGLCPNWGPYWHGNTYNFKEACLTFFAKA